MLQLKVVTPEGSFLDVSADMVELPTIAGELGIFTGHMPLVTAISAGEVRVHRNGEVHAFAIAGGFLQIHGDLVRILASFASEGEEDAQIDLACERARDALGKYESATSAAVEADVAALRAEFAALRKLKRTRGH
jgi:F-type H+-transporting ATPase subunit epsilon